MRIIAGKLGGQSFSAPTGHRTHPMSDKIRGALFNVLGDVTEMTVLDAYAGSGAIAFEAVSRGAAKVMTVEKDRVAQATIETNIKTLALDKKIRLVKANVASWSDRNLDKTYDIVVADPPYDSINIVTLNMLARHVHRDGLFVLSFPGQDELPDFQGMKLLKSMSYGDAQLAFYRKIA